MKYIWPHERGNQIYICYFSDKNTTRNSQQHGRSITASATSWSFLFRYPGRGALFINANVYKTRKWMYIFREKLCSNYSPETILSLHANVAGTFYASSCKTEEKFRLLISFMLFSERYVRCYTDKTVFDIKNILLHIKEELMEKIVKRWKKNV